MLPADGPDWEAMSQIHLGELRTPLTPQQRDEFLRWQTFLMRHALLDAVAGVTFDSEGNYASG
jgi:hypothetical protein